MKRILIFITSLYLLICMTSCNSTQKFQGEKSMSDGVTVKMTSIPNINVTNSPVVMKSEHPAENSPDNEINGKDEKKYPIDIELDKEMKKWSGNTSEGVEIICSNGDKWKKEMEKYYNLLYNELDDNKRKWLDSSHKKWEIYSEDNEELERQIYDQRYHGGSIMHIFYADIYYNKYRERALYLMEKYEELTLDSTSFPY